MNRAVVISVFGSILLIGCTSPFFPLKAMDGVDTHLDFAQWRLSPQPIQPLKVQFGGRIFYATSHDESLSEGRLVVLLVDEEEKVTDIAFP